MREFIGAGDAPYALDQLLSYEASIFDLVVRGLNNEEANELLRIAVSRKDAALEQKIRTLRGLEQTALPASSPEAVEVFEASHGEQRLSSIGKAPFTAPTTTATSGVGARTPRHMPAPLGSCDALRPTGPMGSPVTNPRTLMWSARTALPLALVGLIWATPRLASACHPRTICVSWETEIIDDKFGEYALGETIPARGTKVQLIPPPPEPPLSTYLDQEGCLTFHSQYAYGHKLMVFNEAWIGSLDPLNLIQVRVTRQYTKDAAPQTDFMWPVDLHGIAPNDVVPVTIDTDDLDPIAPLMAIATGVMHRFHELDVFPPSSATLTVEFEEWRGNARGWCNQIEVGPDSFREKFLVAHEMGHWLQCHWDGYFGPLPELSDYSYGDNGIPRNPEEPCRFAVGKTYDLMNNELNATDAQYHGIRSAEWSGAALREGFAHFIASVVFNNTSGEDGIFRYYKDINVSMLESYEDFVDPMLDNSRVSLFGDPLSCDPCYGGERRWTETQCEPDWNVSGVSNGMDWMRFFWYFLAREGAAPTLREILEFFDFAEDNDTALLEFGFDLYNVGPTLRAALDESSLSDFANRFEAANCVMGVYDDVACTP